MKAILLTAVLAVLIFGLQLKFQSRVMAAEKLVPSEFVVKPGQIRWWPFTANSTSYIRGRFRASGGGRNDIESIIAGWDDCENWMNGHQARVIYASGKVTVGNIDVKVPRGKYCIAFSNKMSLVSSKEVAAEITLMD